MQRQPLIYLPVTRAEILLPLYIDGLAQDCGNSKGLSMELPQR